MLQQLIRSVCLLAVVFHVQLIGSCQENPKEPASGVLWSELKHGMHYGIETLRKDERMNTVNALKRGDVYIRCKESGCVLKLSQKNSTFEVLVFPDPAVDSFVFEAVTAAQLKDLGIDILAIETLMRGDVRMPTIPPISTVRTFTLEFRFIARRNAP